MTSMQNRCAVLAVAVFLGAGCATDQALRIPATTLAQGQRIEHQTPGIEHLEDVFAGNGGVILHEDAWLPEKGSDRGVLIVVHGLKDYAARYQGFAQRLVQQGFAVYAFDLRGHGHSGGERTRIDSFDQYLDDLGTFVKLVQKREGGKPIFLFGHSMGGAIATLFVERDRPPLEGLVLSAAALTTDSGGFTRALAKFTGSIAPGLGVVDLPDADFSRDPKVVAAMESDPLVDNSKLPAGTAAELLRAQDRIEDGAATIRIPVLFLHGDKDRITPPAGDRFIYERIASQDKQLKLYPGLVHDLLHEPESATVAGDIEAWLIAHLPPPVATR